MPSFSKSSDDAAARRSRAKQLRKQIKDIVIRPSTPISPKPETPAGFVHRRMAELAKQSKPSSRKKGKPSD